MAVLSIRGGGTSRLNERRRSFLRLQVMASFLKTFMTIMLHDEAFVALVVVYAGAVVHMAVILAVGPDAVQDPRAVGLRMMAIREFAERRAWLIAAIRLGRLVERTVVVRFVHAAAVADAIHLDLIFFDRRRNFLAIAH